MSCPVWVLGTRLGSSSRTVQALNHQAISLALSPCLQRSESYDLLHTPRQKKKKKVFLYLGPRSNRAKQLRSENTETMSQNCSFKLFIIKIENCPTQSPVLQGPGVSQLWCCSGYSLDSLLPLWSYKKFFRLASSQLSKGLTRLKHSAVCFLILGFPSSCGPLPIFVQPGSLDAFSGGRDARKEGREEEEGRGWFTLSFEYLGIDKHGSFRVQLPTPRIEQEPQAGEW